ncbi:MAG: cell division protein ZapB [Pseudomonadota bacterium]|nr:cell division protein ZapB [Pseudomonadota bacterium]
MEPELSQLEAKAARAVEQCERLRAENQDLRQQLATRSDEVKRLSEKLEESRRRIEGLLARMPG